MNTEDHEIKDIYIWKTCTVAGGIYLFFLIERLLKVLFKIRQVQNNRKYQLGEWINTHAFIIKTYK